MESPHYFYVWRRPWLLAALVMYSWSLWSWQPLQNVASSLLEFVPRALLWNSSCGIQPFLCPAYSGVAYVVESLACGFLVWLLVCLARGSEVGVGFGVYNASVLLLWIGFVIEFVALILSCLQVMSGPITCSVRSDKMVWCGPGLFFRLAAYMAAFFRP